MLAAGHALALGLFALKSPVAVAPTSQVTEGSNSISAARLDGAVQEGLGRGNIDADVLAGACEERGCWIERAAEQGRTHVLLPALEQRGPDHHIRIEVVDLGTRETIVVTDEVCEICGEDEIISTVADVTAELIPRLERLEAEPARLVISGEPAGATVEVDGEVVGTLPWEGEVDAGERSLRISSEGYIPLTWTLTASPGVQELVQMNLQRQPPTADESRSRVRLAAGAGLTAVGVLGVGTGIGLFVLDERPYRRDCVQVDVNGRCPRMYESTGPAIAAVAVGGAALVGGVVLLVHTLRERGRSPAEPTVALSRRGVTMALRF